MRFPFAVCILLVLGCQTLFAQPKLQGLLVYQEPSTTYTEAMEYQTFQQDNALYSTLITSHGERKRLKSGGVIAVVPYPPPTFDSFFGKTAATAIATIESIEQAHPSIRAELEKARIRWARALSEFHQSQDKSAAAPEARNGKPVALTVKEGTFQAARISSATPEIVTVSHATGVIKIPVAELTVAQIVLLNRTSETVQLPTVIARPSATSKRAQLENDLTLRIENAGRAVVEFFAVKLDVSPRAFRVWTCFVVLPALVLVLLVGLIFSCRRSAGRIIPSPRAK